MGLPCPYSISEPESGPPSWQVHGLDEHAGGLAADVAAAKVACDTARRLLECVAWLRGARWDGADVHAINARLEPFLLAARSWEEGQS